MKHSDVSSHLFEKYTSTIGTDAYFYDETLKTLDKIASLIKHFGDEIEYPPDFDEGFWREEIRVRQGDIGRLKADVDFISDISAGVSSFEQHKQKKRDKKDSRDNDTVFLKTLNAIEAQDWAATLKYNELSRTIVKTHDIKAVGLGAGSWTDEDEYKLKAWLHRRGINVGATTIHEAVTLVAMSRCFDPIKEHISSLPKWDGERRIDGWLVRYLGADDTRYNRIVGRRFFIQMMARGLNPGCKADWMMILEGMQGKLKSTLFEILASEDLFSDSLPSLNQEKDAADHLQGMWLLEIAELDSLRKAGVDTIKRFLSRKKDIYRPAYGRNTITRPRHCVFVGTTNRDQYLTDVTGNRRFLPVRTGDVDIEALKADREQLLAEAKYWYERGDKHWFDPDEFEEVVQEQEKRRQADPWEEVLEKFLAGRTEVTNPEIYAALGLDDDVWRRDRRTAARKNSAMTALGWVPCKIDEYTRGFKLPDNRQTVDVKQLSSEKPNKNNSTDSTDSTDSHSYRVKEEKTGDRGSETVKPLMKNHVRTVLLSGDDSHINENNNLRQTYVMSGVMSGENEADDFPETRVKCQDCRNFLTNRGRCFKKGHGVVADILRHCDEFERKK